jgi:hypothetical protein
MGETVETFPELRKKQLSSYGRVMAAFPNYGCMRA